MRSAGSAQFLLDSHPSQQIERVVHEDSFMQWWVVVHAFTLAGLAFKLQRKDLETAKLVEPQGLE